VTDEDNDSSQSKRVSSHESAGRSLMADEDAKSARIRGLIKRHADVLRTCEKSEADFIKERGAELGPAPRLIKGALGLTRRDIDRIGYAAILYFRRRASLPLLLQQERLEICRKPAASDSGFWPDLLVLKVAHECSRAVSEATGEFADLLAQAAIARLGRKVSELKFRSDHLWYEVLDFAVNLSSDASAGWWLEHVLGTPEVDEPRFTDAHLKLFFSRLNTYVLDWLQEADRRIVLRGLLSNVRIPRKKTGPGIQEALVANIKGRHPRIAANIEAICNHLDIQRAPLLDKWKKFGKKTWHEAWSDPNMRNRVKRWISGIPPRTPKLRN
jgi:hypothetical protein